MTLIAVGILPLCRAIPAEPEKPGFRDAVDEVQKAAHALGDATPGYYESLEAGFLRVQKDFPGEDEVYSELLFVADRRPKDAAIPLAQRVIDWPASSAVKEKARGLIRKKESLGKPLDLKLSAMKGGEIDVASLKGKVVLVDFWATWCPSCQEKLGELKALYSEHQAHGLEIVGVSFDDKPRRLQVYLDVEGVAWPQHCSGEGWSGPNAKLAARFGLTSLPGLWLVDRKGNLRDLDARENLAAKVRALLAEKP
ncbi:MAG: TlpA family protein disulfide reductase [Verrucomicrobia bacterium]|nr:TlpA family protein disulfide reductase [Verrucomicrobiota bacterium]